MRDALARVIGKTPHNGWALPSAVGGRFNVRYSEYRAEKGRRLLREGRYEDLAALIFADPTLTAMALRSWRNRELSTEGTSPSSEGAMAGSSEPSVDRGTGACTAGAPPMCTTGGHEDIPAVGSALADGDEDDDPPHPYCGECLNTLGKEYRALRWDELAEAAACGHDANMATGLCPCPCHRDRGGTEP